MSVLIKKATIIQEGNPNHLKKRDILIKQGKIEKIAASIKEPAKKTIEGKALHVSPGWMDIGTHSGEPGFEHRETLDSLCAAAAAGGYTRLAVFPNTNPVIDNRTAMSSFAQVRGPVSISTIGALSIGADGKDLSEFIDMHKGGAVAFSDGLRSLADNSLLLRALQYVKSFGGLIIHHPNDSQISHGGEMHEGEVSTSLGLNGIPSMAELSHVERDIKLLDYAESRMLIHLISAKESVEAIKKGKKSVEGLFSSVAFMNLVSTDERLNSFDSNFKLTPPLRATEDKKALIKGLKDGTIDIISSNHYPLEEELKKDAFPYTESGNIGLQVCFSVLWDNLKNDLSIEQLVQYLAVNPRTILGLAVPNIKSGETAELTIFDLDGEWTFDQKTNKSCSSNTPWLGKDFSAKVVACVNGSK